MKKLCLLLVALAYGVPLLAGCSAVGDRDLSVTTVYFITAVASLLLLVSYTVNLKKKDGWFVLLFSSALVVNVGYFMLSAAKSVELALAANTVAYAGSVFLPMSMIMIIAKVCKIGCVNRFKIPLFVLSAAVFAIAASPVIPGMDLYYESVGIETVNGATVLVKNYGPLHVVYLLYIVAYLALMLAIVFTASRKKQIESRVHVLFLVVSVLINVVVWFIEQLVRIDFELLSVSYILTELLLISLYMMIEERDSIVASLTQSAPAESVEKSACSAENGTCSAENDTCFAEKLEYFRTQLATLTPTERTVYELYVDGKSTKEVLAVLGITENTLKYHNKHIYSKLGVSSRKELRELASRL